MNEINGRMGHESPVTTGISNGGLGGSDRSPRQMVGYRPVILATGGSNRGSDQVLYGGTLTREHSKERRDSRLKGRIKRGYGRSRSRTAYHAVMATLFIGALVESILTGTFL